MEEENKTNIPDDFNREGTVKFLEENKVELTGNETDEELIKMCVDVVNSGPELQKVAQEEGVEEFDREKTIAFLKDHEVTLTGNETDEELKDIMENGPKKESSEEEEKKGDESENKDDSEEEREKDSEEETKEEDIEGKDESSDDSKEYKGATVPDAAETGEEVPEPEPKEPTAPNVKGIMHEGKQLAVSHYKGETLVIVDVQGVSYTLSGQELEEFLKKIG